MTTRYHFFLSYARMAPRTGQRTETLDQWAARLFTDLRRRVAAKVPPDTGIAPGFADHVQSPLSDWRSALEGTEVFVPLYSPPYFTKTRTGRELEGFRRRMSALGVDPERRIVPVLWTPPPPPRSGEKTKEWVRAALDIPGLPGTYAENGLQALLRMRMYEDDYQQVLDHLANRIKDISLGRQVGWSPIVGLDSLESPFKDAGTKGFTVLVAAHALPSLPPQAGGEGYGREGSDWQPFPAVLDLPLARCAADIAEQFDFTVSICELGDLPEHTSLPGVVLIDPWFAHRGSGRAQLNKLRLPEWIVPVVVGARTDPHVAELAEGIEEVLERIGATNSDIARRTAHGVQSYDDFRMLMPYLVAEAERQYMRHVPRKPQEPVTADPRPKLNREVGTPEPQSSKEEPHA